MRNRRKIILALIISALAGLLGALGGAAKSSKTYRRFLIPVILLILGLCLKNYSSALILLWIGVLSLGYGIPDETDKGSALGRFWHKICIKNHFWTNFCVKLTLGILFSLILFIIALIRKPLCVFFISAPIAIASQVVFGALIKGLGEFNFFGKKIIGIELARYATLALAGAIQLIY